MSVSNPARINSQSVYVESKTPSPKCRLLFIALMILGVGGLVVAGIGLGGYFGPFNRTISLIMFITGGVSSIALLALGIFGLIKSCNHRTHSLETRGPISLPPTATHPLRTGNPQLLPVRQLSGAKIKELRSYLQTHELLLTDSNGCLFYAWSDRQKAIHIQSATEFGINSNKEKLSLNIDSQGKINVYVDGVLSKALSAQKMQWIQTACAQLTQPEVNSQPVQQEDPSHQRFPTNDLLFFKSIIQTGLINGQNHEIKIDNHLFVAWTDRDLIELYIQDRVNWLSKKNSNLLCISFSNKKSVQIKINGKLQTSSIIPDLFLPQTIACFRFFLEKSTYRYEHAKQVDAASLYISIFRRGLKVIPEFHLDKLSQLISTGMSHKRYPKMEVTFLGNGLGIDRGGLSRDLLDDLFEGLTTTSTLRFQSQPSSFLLPRTSQDQVNNHALPTSLNKDEQNSYNQIGHIFIYCYKSRSDGRGWDKSYSIGRHFDDALFKVALSLSVEEIRKPFHQLQLPTLLKMCRALVEAADESIYLRRIELLLKYDLSDGEWEEAATIAFYADCLPDSLIRDEAPDLSKILKNKGSVKKALAIALFGAKGCIGQIGTLLAPIHAIAQGMLKLEGNNWDNLRSSITYSHFSAKIQGSFNRERIANSFRLDHNLPNHVVNEIQKKLKWLKEWILKDATEEELRKLVKFLTGTSSLPKDKYFTVLAQKAYHGFIPTLRAHSCSFEVDISPIPTGDEKYNDRTKNNFIKSLKELALTDPGAYSMN